MLRTPKEKICECGNHFIQYNSLQKYCSWHCEKKYKPRSLNLKQNKPIRKVSVKQEKLNKEYSILRKQFLSLPENQICPITKQQTTDVHHTMKRIGLCIECQDWKHCFKNNLKLDGTYHDKLETYKNGLN